MPYSTVRGRARGMAGKAKSRAATFRRRQGRYSISQRNPTSFAFQAPAAWIAKRGSATALQAAAALPCISISSSDRQIQDRRGREAPLARRSAQWIFPLSHCFNIHRPVERAKQGFCFGLNFIATAARMPRTAGIKSDPRQAGGKREENFCRCNVMDHAATAVCHGIATGPSGPVVVLLSVLVFLALPGFFSHRLRHARSAACPQLHLFAALLPP